MPVTALCMRLRPLFPILSAGSALLRTLSKRKAHPVLLYKDALITDGLLLVLVIFSHFKRRFVFDTSQL
jgi:hypothetical protein